MTVKRYPHSVRFSKDEWRSITQAAERNEMMPSQFVRGAAVAAAATEIDFNEARLTPELIELIKRTFRGVHLLAYLKREQLGEIGKEEDLQRAAEAAKIAQSETLDSEESDRSL